MYCNISRGLTIRDFFPLAMQQNGPGGVLVDMVAHSVWQSALTSPIDFFLGQNVALRSGDISKSNVQYIQTDVHSAMSKHSYFQSSPTTSVHAKPSRYFEATISRLRHPSRRHHQLGPARGLDQDRSRRHGSQAGRRHLAPASHLLPAAAAG